MTMVILSLPFIAVYSYRQAFLLIVIRVPSVTGALCCISVIEQQLLGSCSAPHHPKCSGSAHGHSSSYRRTSLRPQDPSYPSVSQCEEQPREARLRRSTAPKPSYPSVSQCEEQTREARMRRSTSADVSARSKRAKARSRRSTKGRPFGRPFGIRC